MKKRQQLVLTIVLVVVLLIAVVGATYAFFSATASSANNAISGISGNVTGTLRIIDGTKKISNKLLPVHSEDPNFARYPQRTGHFCEDDNGDEICTLYEFTIQNSASITQTVYVSLVPKTNGFDNLHFAAFNTTAASAVYNVATAYTSGSLVAITSSSNSTIGHQATKLTKNSQTPINMDGLTTTISANSSVTYTILVWLQDTGTNQNAEQSANFEAGINVTTGTGEGVTGDISHYTYVYTKNVVNMINENYVDPSTVVGIGQPIPDSITKYYTVPPEEYSFASPYLIHKIANGPTEVWCADIEGGLNSCDNLNRGAFTETECNQLISALGYTGTCSSRISYNVVVESKVGYSTFELKGGDLGTSYADNITKLNGHFNSNSQCTEFANETTNYVLNYVCNKSLSDVFGASLQALTAYDGQVYVDVFYRKIGVGEKMHHCQIKPEGISFCQYDIDAPTY